MKRFTLLTLVALFIGACSQLTPTSPSTLPQSPSVQPASLPTIFPVVTTQLTSGVVAVQSSPNIAAQVTAGINAATQTWNTVRPIVPPPEQQYGDLIAGIAGLAALVITQIVHSKQTTTTAVVHASTIDNLTAMIPTPSSSTTGK